MNDLELIALIIGCILLIMYLPLIIIGGIIILTIFGVIGLVSVMQEKNENV